MKKVLLSLAIVAIAFSANAQKKDSDKSLKFSVGATIGLPIGDAKTYSNLVYGGDIQGEYAAAETVGVTLSAGYNSFSIKGGFGLTVTAIPVLVGGKFYFAEKFYGHAQAGVAFLNNGGGTGFAYAPGLGYNVAENFDIAVKYQAISKNGTTSYIGLRVAYNF